MISLFFALLAALFFTMKIGNIGDFKYWSWWEVICIHFASVLMFGLIDTALDAIIKFWKDKNNE